MEVFVTASIKSYKSQDKLALASLSPCVIL